MRRALVVTAGVLTAWASVACSGDQQGFGTSPPLPAPPSTTVPPRARPAQMLVVTAPGGLRFEPSVLGARAGETIEIVLRNLDDEDHTLVIDELNVLMLAGAGQTIRVTVAVHPDNHGTFAFYCSRPGHRAGGMEGTLRLRRPRDT